MEGRKMFIANPLLNDEHDFEATGLIFLPYIFPSWLFKPIKSNYP
jgi:hypothetical protein